MVTLYKGQELSLQELFSAFSCKLEEISSDPDKYVVQMALQVNLLFTHACMIAGLLKFRSMRSVRRLEQKLFRMCIDYRAAGHKGGGGDGGRVVSPQIPGKLPQPCQSTPSGGVRYSPCPSVARQGSHLCNSRLSVLARDFALVPVALGGGTLWPRE